MFAATYTISGWALLVFWGVCALGIMPSFLMWADNTAEKDSTATATAVIMALFWPALLLIVGVGVLIMCGLKLLQALNELRLALIS